MVQFTSSKKYQTLVYMREKIRGLHGSDPWIWDDEWDLITQYINNNNIDCQRMGQRSFSIICRSVKKGDVFPFYYKKYGERWVQARIRLGYEGPEPMSLYLLKSICMRTKIYQEAHKEFIAYKITNKNAINLNYVLLQFIRMDSPEEFDQWKRYIKISTCKLSVYNDMWKKIMMIMALKFSNYFEESSYSFVKIEWTYVPLKEHDLYVPERLAFK